MEITEIILKAVEVLKKSFGGIEIEILDTEMTRKYPDSFVPLGYLGVSILINSGVNKHKVFLKYQFAEDMLFGDINPLFVAESFIIEIIREDIPKLEIKFKMQQRKQKLIQINEFNN